MKPGHKNAGRLPRRIWILGIALVLLLALIVAGLRFDGMVWLAEANRWVADTFIRRLGYWGVFLLMFIESSLIPFPSEIIIPPAADLARRLPGWQLEAVIALGIAGSLAGALFNYMLALTLGRPLLLRMIRRYGAWVRIGEEDFGRAEAFFLRHGAISTLIGRLIPVVRQLVSLPAGLARMNLAAFSLLTALGAGVWVGVLAAAGYWFGANAERLGAALRSYSLWMLVAVVVLIVAYAIYCKLRNRRLTMEPSRGGPQ